MPPLRHRLLGHSGLRVSELCLGTMTFGEDWGWGAPKEEAKKIFDRFAEAGGDAQVAALDEASAIPPSFVQRFVSQEMVQTFVYGGMRDRLDVD